MTNDPPPGALLAYARGLVNDGLAVLLARLLLVPTAYRPWAIHCAAAALVDLDALPAVDQGDEGSLKRQLRETGRRLLREMGPAAALLDGQPGADPKGGA